MKARKDIKPKITFEKGLIYYENIPSEGATRLLDVIAIIAVSLAGLSPLKPSPIEKGAMFVLNVNKAAKRLGTTKDQILEWLNELQMLKEIRLQGDSSETAVVLITDISTGEKRTEATIVLGSALAFLCYCFRPDDSFLDLVVPINESLMAEFERKHEHEKLTLKFDLSK